MSNYLVDEAQESDGEENTEYTAEERKRLKKLRTVQSDSSDDEDDEEDEQKMQEESKGFINDDDDEDEDEDMDSDVEGKRKRDDDDDDDLDADNLDEDDLDLIEENIGVKIDRKKKFKRLKRIEDEDSDAEEGDAKTQIEKEIFQGSGDEEDEEQESSIKPTQPEEYGSEEEGEDSDGEGSFIVDDDGKPMQKHRKKPMEDEGLEAARDIFGIDFDYGEFEHFDDGEEGDEEADDDDYEDEEDGEREPTRRVHKERRKGSKKSIYEVFEPSELERGHHTSQDHHIRKIDIPERFQLRRIPVTMTRGEGDDRSSDKELDEEAKWIYEHAFVKPFISNQEGREEAKQRSRRNYEMIGKILNALDLIRNSTCEVPFIAFYRKEEVQPELNIQDLWKIYKWDEKWCQLKSRKSNFKNFVSKMMEYQTATIMKDMDAPLPEDIRLIKEEDIYNIENIESTEQFNDYYKHFLLYYGKDQEPMREHFKNKTKEKTYRTVTKKVLRKIRRKKHHKKKANIGEDDDEDGEDVVKQVNGRKDDDEDEGIGDEEAMDKSEGSTIRDKSEISTAGEISESTTVSEKSEAPTLADKSDGSATAEKSESSTAAEKSDGSTAAALNGENSKESSDEEEVEVEVETEVEEEVPDEELPEDDPDALKKAVRRHEYELLKKAGIYGFALKFGMTPEQFGENVRDSYQRNEVEQHQEDSAREAENYISKMCDSPERVTEAAVRIVGWQLACEPLVRNTLRELYFERARISVRPTPKGLKVIDEHHNLYPIKYLYDKPVSDLQGDMFLKIKSGVEEKIITFSLSDTIEGNTTGNYMDELKQLYYRDEFSQVVQDWNDLRGRAVEFAFNRIVADLKRELTQRLLQEAKDHVLEMCCRKLYNFLKIAPYKPGDFADEDEDDWDMTKGYRVFSIAYLPDEQEAAFGCCIDIDGDCCEFIRLPDILKRRNGYNERDAMAKETDLGRVKEFIVRRKPHVIVVGAESREALMIVADIKDILKDLEEQDQFPKINVELLDNQMSIVYSVSKKGQADFLDYPPLLRQAISLGRLLQDPLAEYSQICNTDDEILNLRLHPFQDQLDNQDLLDALHTEFVNRTNEVGVDLNMAVAYSHKQNLIQFVCGLGPRKANSLLKSMKQSNSRLENRNQLVVNYHMGPKVFINCAGFIKIDTNALGDSENYIEVLDSTRIHPEAYDWARKMAVDALEYDDDEGKPAEALEEILETPERLSELDLEAFAVELNNQGFGKKNITLYDIRHELNHRYKDFRQEFKQPSLEEIFNMLTKESPETFYVGKLVQAVVNNFIHRKPHGEQLDNANPVRNEETGLWQCPFCLKNDFPELSEVWNHFDAEDCPGQAVGVRCRLDNGIGGFIHIKNISDKTVTNPADRLRIRGIVHCRITKIDPEKFSVDLTSKTSDLQDVDKKWRPSRDPYYDYSQEEKDRNKEKKKSEKKTTQYHKRVIAHPSFKNIGFNEAEKLMQTMEQGDALIRPSSKGSDHLTVTWKVTLAGICQHIDVKEQDKKNEFSLGKKLWIGNEEFEDLDEILARHIAPMAANARQIIDYKYFKESFMGNKERVNEYLKEEKKKNAKNIPYLFTPVKILPGKFMLSYLPRVKVIHEYVTIVPEGFKFRNKYQNSLANLLKWFKSNFRNAVKAVGATPGMMTNRTPYLGTTPNIGVDSSTIHKVAQNLPSHMLHSLSAAANTPHSHFGTPYSQFSNYATTPYTPSSQTPFMTPYATTPGPSLTPRYGSQTPSHQHHFQSVATTPVQVNQGIMRLESNHAMRGEALGMRGEPNSGVRGEQNQGSRGETDWQKAAAAWAQAQGGPRRSGGSRTPRQEDNRVKYDENRRNNFQYENNPRMTPRSTPKSVQSPSAMSIGGDQTPLYDE